LNAPDKETIARTTTEFLQEFQVQVAINAGYFYPFREKTPWNYYPHSGERVNVVGQGISAGAPYSPPQPDWPVLCFDQANRVQILETGLCPPGTMGAIAGNTTLPLSEPPAASDQNRPYGRTIVATDTTGETLWLIVVDGKQPHYSEGLTLAEVDALRQEIGAAIALNLDGGGSSTLGASFSKPGDRF
jgi:exopolysaccharide biosynthesis protein